MNGDDGGSRRLSLIVRQATLGRQKCPGVILVMSHDSRHGQVDSMNDRVEGEKLEIICVSNRKYVENYFFLIPTSEERTTESRPQL